MKSWIKRFGMLAVLGTIVGSALVAGCGNGATEDEAAPGATPTEEGAAKEPAADAGDGS